MEKILGLVLIGSVARPTTIPPEEVSLVGKPIVSHATEALSMICEEVLVEHAINNQESDADIVARALERLQRKYQAELLGNSHLIIHDAFRPVLWPQLLQQIQQATVSGAVIVATSSILHGQAFLEAPLAFRISGLERYLRNMTTNPESLGDLACAVARYDDACVTLAARSFIGGRLFEDLSLNEAEAILRVKENSLSGVDQEGSFNFHNVLVLGGSGGIGQACIKLLRERNVSCLVPSREELDLRYMREFKYLEGVDAVIHSAGAYACSAREIMEVNFHSCLRLLAAAEASGWTGSIVFLSSTAATYGRSGAPVYSASKAALNSLVEAEAERLARCGIRINAVAPAKVATRLQDELNPGTPMEEMISPDYVARTVLRVLDSLSHGRIVYLRKGEDI